MREQREWQRLIDNPQQTLDSTERHALLFCKENRAFGGVAWLILTPVWIPLVYSLRSVNWYGWAGRILTSIRGCSDVSQLRSVGQRRPRCIRGSRNGMGVAQCP